METKDREPDNQRFKEPVYGIRRTDQTKEGAVFKKAEEDYINRNPVSYTHLTLPTILRV